MLGDLANEGAADDGAVGPALGVAGDLPDLGGGGDAEADTDGGGAGPAESGDVWADVWGKGGAFTGDAGDGEVVDEAVAKACDGLAACGGRGGGDEEGGTQVGVAHDGGDGGGFFEGDIREDDAVELVIAAHDGEIADAAFEDDGEGDHGYDGDGKATGAGGGDGGEGLGDGAAVGEGVGEGGLDDGAIGDGVGKGDAQFDDAGVGGEAFLDGQEEIGGGGEGGIAGGEEGAEEFLAGADLVEDGLEAVHEGIRKKKVKQEGTRNGRRTPDGVELDEGIQCE